jgi:hypothetical protein
MPVFAFGHKTGEPFSLLGAIFSLMLPNHTLTLCYTVEEVIAHLRARFEILRQVAVTYDPSDPPLGLEQMAWICSDSITMLSALDRLMQPPTSKVA